MNWTHWNLFDFLCYTGFVFLVSSIGTARYMLKNKAWIIAKEKELDKSKDFTAYKLKDKPWWYIRFHRPGTIPEDYEKRIYPPLHPGGPVEREIDTFIISKMSEGKTRKQAWNEAIENKFYPDNAIADSIYMRGEYNNMKKRINNRYPKSSTK